LTAQQYDNSRVESAVIELAGYFYKTILDSLSRETNQLFEKCKRRI